MASDTRSDTELVFAARGPDPQAFNTLFERWFPKAWNVARNILRDDDLAADIAQEAVLTAWERLDELENVDSFGGWLLRIARNRALNKLDRERRSLSADDETVSGLRDSGGFDPTAADRLRQPDQVSDAHDQQELVWAASVALGPNDASLLDLHLRHGLSATEIADELGVSANTAHQQLFRLKGKLGKAVGSYLLWRHGRPLCENLAKAVSGSVAFDQSVSQAVTRHEKTCSSCAGDRKALVSPAKLFSSAPLVVMPLHLQAKAAAALAEAGVPVQLAPISTESAPSETDQSETGQSETDQSDTGQSDTGRYSEPPANPATEHTIANRQFLEQTHRRSSEFQETTSPPSPSRWNSRVLVGASGGAVCLALVGGILYLAFGFGADDSVIETNVAVEASQEEADLEPDADNSQGSAARNGDSAASTLDPTELLTAPQSPVPAGPQVARPAPNPDDTSGGSTTTPAAPNPASTVSLPTSGSSSTVLPPTPTSGPSSGTPTSNPTTSNPSTGSSQTSRPTTPTSTVSSPVTPTSTGTSTSGTATTPTSSNTTVPVSPSTPTRPTTSSPSSSSVPGPSTSSPTPTPTSPDVDPPEIQRFLATQATDPGDCGRRQAFLARWSALNTDSVTLTTPSGSFNGGASGQQSFCGAAGDTIGLVAVGPGGETRGSAQL